MNKKPIWKIDNKSNYNTSLISDIDILIIGGGITGIMAGYFLRNNKENIALIEKDEIGFDATYKSTAKISFIQKDIYQKLEKAHSYGISKLYFESQKSAMNTIIDIINKENIKCDLNKVDSFLFTSKEKNLSKLNKEKELLESFGTICYEQDNLPIPYDIKKCFYVKDNYTINPKKYVNEIARIIKNKISIIEKTLAINITKNGKYYTVITNKGQLQAKKVIIATHYPFFILPNIIPLRNYISREYINTAKYNIKNNFTAINIEKNTESIRFYDDNIMYVSNNHRLTNRLDYQENYKKSRNNFKFKFNKESENTWMNQDLMTNDYLPIIGYSNLKDKNLFISTGYNAWGITNGILGAKIISDLINDKKNKFYDLFKPQRISLTAILNTLIDGIFYMKAYTQALVIKQNKVYTIKLNNEKYLLYIDDNNKKHYVKEKCPHMKCKLVFNNEEKTWDCPCHGSRFDFNGNLLTGPSNHNIK